MSSPDLRLIKARPATELAKKSVKKTAFIGSLILGPFLFLSVSTYVLLAREAESFADLKANNLQGLGYLSQIAGAWSTLHYALPDYLIQGQERRTEIRSEKVAAQKRLEIAMQNYAPLADTELERSQFAILKHAQVKYLQDSAAFFSLIADGKEGEAKELLITQISKTAADAQRALERLENYQNFEAAQKEQVLQIEIEFDKNVLFSLVAFGVLAFGYLIFSRSLGGTETVTESSPPRFRTAHYERDSFERRSG